MKCGSVNSRSVECWPGVGEPVDRRPVAQADPVWPLARRARGPARPKNANMVLEIRRQEVDTARAVDHWRRATREG